MLEINQNKVPVRTLTLIISCILHIAAYSVQPDLQKPRGKFLTDSVRVGEIFPYSISYRYAENTTVLFPDTGYNYFPFELVRKKYFPTSTQSAISTDSVIYFLRTFEVFKIQKISLPVFIIEGADSLAEFTSPDSVFLNELTELTAETADFSDQTGFMKVEEKFNFPYFTAALLSFLMLGAGIYFLLGKSILMHYKLYNLRKSYKTFLNNYEISEQEYLKNYTLSSVESALTSWKNYLSRLENKPVDTFTTTEIIHLFGNQQLKDTLQAIDQAIYGGLMTKEQAPSLAYLKKFSNKRFQKRKKAIRNVHTGK